MSQSLRYYFISKKADYTDGKAKVEPKINTKQQNTEVIGDRPTDWGKTASVECI